MTRIHEGRPVRDIGCPSYFVCIVACESLGTLWAAQSGTIHEGKTLTHGIRLKIPWLLRLVPITE